MRGGSGVVDVGFAQSAGKAEHFAGGQGAIIETMDLRESKALLEELAQPLSFES